MERITRVLTGAAAGGHNDVVEFMFGRGANVNARDGGPLMIASRLGQAETARLRSSPSLDKRLQRYCQALDEGGSPVAWR
jgi:hypothetical protein